MMTTPGEGAYMFFPELEAGGWQYLHQYSQLNQKIDHIKGMNLD